MEICYLQFIIEVWIRNINLDFVSRQMEFKVIRLDEIIKRMILLGF